MRNACRPSTVASNWWASSLCATTTSFRFNSTVCRSFCDFSAANSIWICPKLPASNVRRFVVEKPRELGVFDHDGRVLLNGVEVFLLKGVAGLRRHEHFPCQRKGHLRVFGSDGLFGSEGLVDSHHEFRDVMEPGELRMVHHETKQLSGIDVTVLALIRSALHL